MINRDVKYLVPRQPRRRGRILRPILRGLAYLIGGTVALAVLWLCIVLAYALAYPIGQ